MRLEEPECLVEVARRRGEDVGRVRIARLVSVIDCLARGVGDLS